MSSKRKTRKKIKKSQFSIIAPATLNFAELNDIVAKSGEDVISKVCKPLLYEITEDLQHQNIELKLKINKIKDDKAYTLFAGHNYTREYVRALVMRGTSYVQGVIVVETQDGFKYRVTFGAFTIRRINTSRKKDIRKIGFDIIRDNIVEEQEVYTCPSCDEITGTEGMCRFCVMAESFSV